CGSGVQVGRFGARRIPEVLPSCLPNESSKIRLFRPHQVGFSRLGNCSLHRESPAGFSSRTTKELQEELKLSTGKLEDQIVRARERSEATRSKRERSYSREARGKHGRPEAHSLILEGEPLRNARGIELSEGV